MYPIKLSVKTEIIPLLIIVAGAALSVYFYAHFPAMVVSHWNFEGQPDGYMSKATGAIFMPALITAVYLLMLVLPRLDPKAERYESFGRVYLLSRTLIMGFMLAIYFSSGLYNLGYNVNIRLVVTTLAGLLVLVLGNYMGKIKPNWFMGIRTPWTLSSENVWNKTHRFSGRVFILLGVILITCGFLPKTLSIVAFIAGIVLASLGSVGYSFLAYQQEKKNRQAL